MSARRAGGRSRCRRPSGPDPRRSLAKRMADDHPVGKPTAAALDLAFDSGTLGVLRAGVKTRACQAGLPEDRAEDVVLAVHELAANAVHHGAGTGRLRLWRRAGTLYCQIDDGGPLAAEDPAEQRAGHGEGDISNAPEASGWSSVHSLPSRPGHGLWVVRQLADRMWVLSGARGTRAMVTFNLPGRPGQGCPLPAPPPSTNGPRVPVPADRP
jgi:anti-sigma regulatory factor (Ser/Thr protein kinase)